MKFSSFSNFLCSFYTIALIILSLLLSEVVHMIKSAIRFIGFDRKPSHPLAMRGYLALVEGKVPVIQFEKRSKQGYVECAVCICKLEEGDMIRESECKHVFHKDCLDEWLERKMATCPVCRYCILPEEALIEQWRNEQAHCANEQWGLWFHPFHGSNLY